MERILATVILPDGLPLDICQEMYEEVSALSPHIEYRDGLKVIRVAGGRITAPEGHALLKNAGREDIIDRFKVPAY